MRCSFKVENPTKYPVLDRTKSFVEIKQSYLWSVACSKVSDYQVRLYYEWLHCKSLGGCAFYYTLTYNDASVPYYHGFPCFDYNDIRDFVNGAFVKKLTRTYHCSFKYFISCESGEGKGKRGYGNNPHYHCIFFTYPADESYKPVNRYQFQSLVRKYWQGFDLPAKNPTVNPQYFYKGIVKAGTRPGKNDVGLIESFHALTYVCKYVVKDITAFHSESDSLVDNAINKKRKFSSDRYSALKTCLWSMAYRECYDNPNHKWSFCEEKYSDSDFVEYGCRDLDSNDSLYLTFSDWFCDKNQVAYARFIEPFVRDRYHEYMKEYLNRYSGKVRISNGVGLSAKDYVLDLNEPSVPLPSSKGIKNVPVGRYIYRKLFYDVKRDPVTNNVYYTYNDVGKDILLNNLDKSLKVIQDSFLESLLKVKLGKGEFEESYYYDKIFDYVKSNPKYFSVCDSLPSYHDFCDMVSPYFGKVQSESLESLSYRYALYKKVYEGRFFASESRDSVEYFPSISPCEDYSRFLTDNHTVSAYNPAGFSIFNRCVSDLFLPYSSHPYFHPYIDTFRILDIVRDYFDWTKSEVNRKRYLEKKKVLDFHT